MNNQEHNPFEQSFAKTTPTYEFIQINTTWSSDTSSTSSEDSILKKKSNNSRQKKPRKRAPKKFNNEEDRRDFLERNRIAALKCRQRKKQWLSNLQNRFEFLTHDNEQLELETQQMKYEIIELKKLLAAHKDCPIIGANRPVLVVNNSSSSNSY